LGSAAVPLIYSLGKILFDKTTGLVAALLLTFCCFHVQYSQEARSYALLLFVFGFTLYFLILLQQSSRLGLWIGYTICGILLMYIHGISPFFLASLSIFFLFDVRTWNKKILKCFLLSNVVILVCFLPWVLTYVRQIEAFGHQTQLPIPSLSRILNTFIWLGSLPLAYASPSALQDWGIFSQLISLAWMVSIFYLFLVPFVGRSYNELKPVFGLYLLFAIPIAMIFSFSVMVRSVYLDRIFIVCLIPLSLILAASLRLSAPRLKLLTYLFLIVFVSCNILSIHLYYQKDWKADYRTATEYLVQNASPGDVLIFVANVGEILFDWYSRGRSLDIVKTGLPEGIYDHGEPDSLVTIKDSEDIARLNDIIHLGSRFWLVRNHSFIHDPLELSQHWLDEHLNRGKTIDFNRIQIICYQIKRNSS